MSLDKITVYLRFYEELNDFLLAENRRILFSYEVAERTAIKDVIESLGVPHTEVDLIIVNGESVKFNYKVQNNDSISIYPVFESIDITSINHLRPKPLRQNKFILDVHLGKLAKHLRLLGFDVHYENNLNDAMIIKNSIHEHRIILTRDRGILKNNLVTHGYWVRNTNSEKQTLEVLKRFDLYHQCRPFTRCLECNGSILPLRHNEQDDTHLVKLMCCEQCDRIYWEGSHYKKLYERVKKFLESSK